MKDVQKWIRIQALVVLVMFIGVAALAAYTLYEASQNRAAFCKFRGDLEQRVDNTQTFLDEHPGPEPIPGIPRATLQRSLDGQRATVKSLSNLDC